MRTMRVEADLGEQPGEQRGDRRGGVRVAVGQPEVQRHHRRLDPEHHQRASAPEPSAGRAAASCTRSDRSARFTVAVAAYTIATAVRNSSDDSRLTVTYVMPARIVCAVVRRVISTYDAVSMISNETNSVNRSPDEVGQRDPGREHQVHRVERRARHPPAVVGDALGDRVARARPARPASTPAAAASDSRSATSAIPTGGAQPPSAATTGPVRSAATSSTAGDARRRRPAWSARSPAARRPRCRRRR